MMYMNPWSEFDNLRREFERIFHSTGKASNCRQCGEGSFSNHSTEWYPRINLFESDGQYDLEALAPGLNAGKIDVTLEKGVLSIRGEKENIFEKTNPKTTHLHERAAGHFERRVKVPEDVDSSRIEAQYKNGVLAITLPKREESRPRSIQVNVANN